VGSVTSSPEERRSAQRRSFATNGSNPVVATVGLVPRAAFLADLSTGGAGLVTTDPPPVGSIVPLWLAIPPGSLSRLVLVRVVYSLPVSEDLHRVGLACLDEAGANLFRELLAQEPPAPG
jgi:hypothetical protein